MYARITRTGLGGAYAALLSLASPDGLCQTVSSLLPNGTIYFPYLGTQVDTLSTSVLNDPSFFYT
jgi:hypothetical protein